MRPLVIGFTLLLLGASTPVHALEPQEKMTTCNFGADDQKLKGAKRKSFMTKCMADADAQAKPANPQKKK
ncbi:MAG: PsiF family protein [Pseudomonadota bacterium]|nr:PsiF family protein [Pseudomonadota bacterium]